VVLCE
jgi:hypothetical protein